MAPEGRSNPQTPSTGRERPLTEKILRHFFFNNFFRFLAVVRSTPPKIGKNAKFPLSIFFDFLRRCAARRQKSEKIHAFIKHFFRVFAVVHSTLPKLKKMPGFMAGIPTKFRRNSAEIPKLSRNSAELLT